MQKSKAFERLPNTHILERYVWESDWWGEKVSFLARHLVLARHSWQFDVLRGV